VQLADGSGINRRDLDERTAPEYEVSAPALGDGDRVESVGGHVLFEHREDAVMAR